MATGNRKRVIEYIFQSTDRTSKVLKDMSQSSEAFGKSLTGVAGPIASLTGNLLKVEAAVLALGAAFVVFATNKAIQFEDSLVELDKVLREGEGNLDDLGLRAIDAGNKFGEFGGDVLSSAANFKQAGFTIDESFSLVEQSLTAARISELDAAEASELLIRVLKGFDLPATEAGRVLDLANEASANYAASLPQLLEALARTSSVSKNANISIEESIGVLTNIIQPIQSAEIASRAYSTSIQRLGSDNSKVAEGFEKLGLSVADVNPAFNTTGEVLRKVQERFQELPENLRGSVAQLLVGADQASKFSRALSGLEQQTEITATAVGGIGVSSAAELEKAFNSVSGQLARVTATFENLQALIGKQFLGSTKSVADAIINLNIKLQDLVRGGGLAEFLKVFDSGAASIKAFVESITVDLDEALKLVDTSQLLAGLRDLGTALEELGIAFDIGSDARSLADGLQLIVDIATQVIAFNEGMVEAVTPVVDIFKELLDLVSKIPAPVADLAGKIGALSIGLVAIGGTFIAASAALKSFSFLLAGPKGSLASALTTAGTSRTAFAGGLITLGPIFFAAGQAIGQFVNSLTPLADGLDRARGFVEDITFAIPGFVDLVITTGEKIDEWTGSNTKAKESLDQLSESTEKTTEAVSQLNTVLPETVATASQTSAELFNLVEVMGNVSNKGIELASAQELLAKGFTTTTLAIGSATDNFRAIEGVITNIGSASSKTADELETSLDKSVTESEKFRLETANLRLEFEKLASQERKIQFEVQADLKVKEIEQGTKRITEAFETIRAGIESTQEGLSSLVGGLLDASGSNRTLIRELVREEEKRRKAAFKLSEEREKAELKLLRAQTNFFKNGESLIQVNGDNLRPHLVALFLEVLEEASFQINANGKTFLAALPQAL